MKTEPTMKAKVVVGQELVMIRNILKGVGKLTDSIGFEPIQVEVVKVGRKFFTVRAGEKGCETEFSLDQWRQKTEYAPIKKLFLSNQDFENELKREILFKEIMGQLNWHHKDNFTLEQLEAISEIINQ